MLIGFDATSVGKHCTGIENYALFLARELPKIDRENRYLIFARDGFVQMPIRDERVEIVECKGGRLFAQYVPLVLTVLKRRVDFVHFPAFPPPPTITAPIVATIHDAVVWKHPETVTPRSRLYFDALYRIAARRAAAIVTDSESAKLDITNILDIPDERIHVVYPGVGKHFSRISDPARLKQVRNRLGLPEAFVLFVGTFEPRKNIGTLIESFKKFWGRYHKEDVWLVLAGRAGWGQGEIARCLASCGTAARIKVLGYVPASDLVYLYNLAMAFVYPSFYEGFGLPPLEAMACGTPALVSNIPTFRELTCGAAALADPRSVDDLATGLERICFDKNLRARLSEEGPRVAGQYTWERAAVHLVKLYTEVFS
jgi:glycosyltransferase involved in cell wall biosynthesis